MSFLGIFLLTTAVSISNADETSNALKAIGKAAYKGSNLEENIKKLEKKYISEEYQIYGGYTIGIVKIIQEKKITYEWTF